MFRSSHFLFFFCGHFWQLSYKIRKFYAIYFHILQGKMGKTEENRKENYPTKVNKMPKTKRRKYGMNETLDVFFTNVILWYPFYFLGAKTHRTSTISMNNNIYCGYPFSSFSITIYINTTGYDIQAWKKYFCQKPARKICTMIWVWWTVVFIALVSIFKSTDYGHPMKAKI